MHSANEPRLIAGVATYALEIFEALPEADVVIVPVGGGSGASGVVTVRDALGARAEVIGVQAARADAFARSWRGPERVVGERADTFAEGVATRVTFDFTFGILKRGLADVVTLEEDELADGVRLALRATHNLAEGAGAASLAAARSWPAASAAGPRVRDERREPRLGDPRPDPVYFASSSAVVNIGSMSTGTPSAGRAPSAPAGRTTPSAMSCFAPA